jgi:molecular chaperone HscB
LWAVGTPPTADCPGGYPHPPATIWNTPTPPAVKSIFTYLCSMNYFELFEIPVNLKVDKSRLALKYFELQKKYHPDFFTHATEEEKAAVLEKSSLVNKAFKTFQKHDETIKYVLMQKGLMQEEEKYELPPDFLMQMMELNEELSDTGTVADEALDGMEKDLYEKVSSIIENYTEGVTTKEEMLQVKDYYYKKKYLQRIRERIRNIASRF